MEDFEMKFLTGSLVLGLAAAGPAMGATLVNNETFSTEVVTAGVDDSAATSTLYGFTYAESNDDLSEVRVQNNPFGNGGTVFIADLADVEQTVTYASSAFGGSSYDTSTALTLSSDMASNFGTGVTSGIVIGGATSDLLITWNPGGTTYSAGDWAGFGNGTPTDAINGATFAGGAAAPTGTALANVTASIIENGPNYDVTLTVGGSANNFSVAAASLGTIDEIGYYNVATGGGNTNVDNVTLTGEVVPEPGSLALLGLGGLLIARRRRA